MGKTERERLIELISEAKDIYPTIPLVNGCKPEFKNFLADYLLAKGVIVLPCEIGGKLYDAGEFFFEGCSCPEIYELQDDEMTIHKRQYGEEYRFTYDSFYIGHDDIGKTVFLSREEAEKALKEKQDVK